MWRIDITKLARRALDALDPTARENILLYLYERVAPAENPEAFGKPLAGKLKGLWRYRVGDYRLICRIHKETITVLVLDIGHRKDIYR